MNQINAKSFVELHPHVVLKANGEFDARFSNEAAAKAHAEFIHGYVQPMDCEAVL